jgi:hypothetical protein
MDLPTCRNKLTRRFATTAGTANAEGLFGATLRRRYNGPVITLSENEERLVEALRALPPDAAEQVITWATRLRDLANGKNVDWSATWTEEDLADAQRASLSSFDERERDPS